MREIDNIAERSGESGRIVFGIIITVVIALVYFLGVILVFDVVNTIFNTALYVYADTGKIPEGYSQKTMQNAFRPKEMKTYDPQLAGALTTTVVLRCYR